MKIELRNVKHAAFASQDSSCFNATVYIDGKKAGEVSNDGHGGCNMYHPWKLEEQIDAHAKTLPRVWVGEKHFPEGIEQTADILIGELLETYLVSREVQRRLASHILFIKNGKVYMTKKVSKEMIAGLAIPAKLADAKRQLKTDTILNAMAFPEALKLYRELA